MVNDKVNDIIENHPPANCMNAAGINVIWKGNPEYITIN